ncbi:MAG: hypothetical protein IJO54_08270 [Oscillospiraceae bacterium]|nr:hypothetical protein [Oscillospiraceae bacterium]
MNYADSKFNTISLPNARVKIYPDGTQELLVCSKGIFNPEGIESSSRKAATVPECNEDTHTEQSALNERSIRRAQKAIKDYILCNDFTHFVTITINPQQLDRADWGAIIKPLNKWLDNRVQRKGLKYVLVPELHSDGKSIHLHGVVNGDALRLVDSGTVKVDGLKKPIKMSTYKRNHNGKPFHTVYNVSDWKYGFTTAIPLYGSRAAVAAYVGKYLEKDLQKIGGRIYLHSSNLEKPKVEYYHAAFDDIEVNAFNFNNVNIWWKYQLIEPKSDTTV